MHHSAATHATFTSYAYIPKMIDDGVDLLYHCNMLVSLFTVSGLPSFK